MKQTASLNSSPEKNSMATIGGAHHSVKIQDLAGSNHPSPPQPVKTLWRPKSSYLGNPSRKVQFESKVFTTDVVTVDKKLDDVEDMILKYNKRPHTTDKRVRIDIDLNDKQYQTMKLQGSQMHLHQITDQKQQQRLQSASTKYTITQSNNQNKKSRIQSGIAPSTQISSPLSRNQPVIQFKKGKLSQMTSIQHSDIKLRTQEYQKFFQKNQDSAFGIAECVLKGNKIQTLARFNMRKQQSQSNVNMQTEDVDSATESDIMFNQQLDQMLNQEDNSQQQQSEIQKEPNLIYKGAYVKIYQPEKETKAMYQSHRPMSAAPMQLKSRSQKTLIQTKNIEQPMKIDDITEVKGPESQQQQQQLSKMKSYKIKDDYQQQSMFKDKKAKILGLSDYLNMVLEEYYQNKYKENEQEINQTITSYMINQSKSQANLQGIGTDSISDNNFTQHQNSQRTSGKQSGKSMLQELEQKKMEEESAVSSTGLRLRMLTAKFGPKVDLISHGFQHFKVSDIEQFFDPMRLKLMTCSLSDIPNQQTKQGSDFHFIKGCKYQLNKEYQKAINIYEQGILEYPASSFNCRFNKGVILFKLGLFKEALNIYNQLYKEDVHDKRICYNKAICEIQCGRFKQCISTIDQYINDFKSRKLKLEQETSQIENGVNKSLSYQEKIKLQKPHYNPDDKYLLEIYQVRGVACLRSNRVLEAAQSFTLSQEFKPKQQIPGFDGGDAAKDENFVDITFLDHTSSKLDMKKASNYSGTGILFEDQDENEPSTHRISTNIRIRPMTAKLPRSQSQRQITQLVSGHQRLETLEEEENIYTGENKLDEQFNTADKELNDRDDTDLDHQKVEVYEDNIDHLFSIDPDAIMKDLDDYDKEHKTIKQNVDYIQKHSRYLNFNRNIDEHLQQKRPKTAITSKNVSPSNFYFTQNNLMVNVEQPKGAILQFLQYNQQVKQETKENKEFKKRLETYDLTYIKNKPKEQKELHLGLRTDRSQSESQRLSTKRPDFQEVEIENEIFIRPNDYYIDKDKKIRIEKVLLGFEVDYTQLSTEEQKVRQRRRQIDHELTAGFDLYYDGDDKEEEQRNKEFFYQFLKIQEKQAFGIGHGSMAKHSIQQLDYLQSNIGNLRMQIDKLFADPKKTELNLKDSGSVIKLPSHNASQSQNSHQTSKSQSIFDLANVKEKKSKAKKILRRIPLVNLDQALTEFKKSTQNRNYEILNAILGKLKFFIKFPNDIRLDLFRLATLRQYEPNETIFAQGEESYSFFVIIRGSVCIQVNKEEMGFQTVNHKVCYEGDYIGELIHFEHSPTLSPSLIQDLNSQRTTALAMEECYLLEINKARSNQVINAGLQGQYEERIQFLKQIDIFADIDIYILLPLASNIQIKTYKYGEYIAKAGEMPEGLIIINKGQCTVCAEKLAMRSNQPSEYQKIQQKNPNIKTNPTGSSSIVYDKNAMKKKNMKMQMVKGLGASGDNQRYFSDTLQQVNAKNRAYQNELILADDNGKRMKDFIVYKDLMVFFDLLPKSYFGGRVLLPPQQEKKTKDEQADKSKQSGQLRRGAWFAGGKQPAFGRNGGDFEHLFIKRRYSKTTQAIIKNDRSSMLSIIANSAEVEVYIIDEQLMEFFPENTQKQIWNKLMNVFEPDRPYMLKNVQKIKDKFREWDVYKIKTVQEKMKENFNQRQSHKQKQVVELER